MVFFVFFSSKVEGLGTLWYTVLTQSYLMKWLINGCLFITWHFLVFWKNGKYCRELVLCISSLLPDIFLLILVWFLNFFFVICIFKKVINEKILACVAKQQYTVCKKGESPWTYVLQRSNVQPSPIQMLIRDWMFLCAESQTSNEKIMLCSRSTREKTHVHI